MKLLISILKDLLYYATKQIEGKKVQITGDKATCKIIEFRKLSSK